MATSQVGQLTFPNSLLLGCKFRTGFLFRVRGGYGFIDFDLSRVQGRFEF